jgi:hypothetical protein
MDPQNRFCHNSGYLDRGQSGRGNIRIHSRKEQRYQCRTCGWTFAVALYRLPKETDVVIVVLILLCHGGMSAVAAFGFDERMVARWQARTAHHLSQVHGHLIESMGKWSWDMYKQTNCGSSGWASGCGWRWPWRCRHA